MKQYRGKTIANENILKKTHKSTFCQRLRDFFDILVSPPSCALVPGTNWIAAIVAWRIQD